MPVLVLCPPICSSSLINILYRTTQIFIEITSLTFYIVLLTKWTSWDIIFNLCYCYFWYLLKTLLIYRIPYNLSDEKLGYPTCRISCGLAFVDCILVVQFNIFLCPVFYKLGPGSNSHLLFLARLSIVLYNVWLSLFLLS